MLLVRSILLPISIKEASGHLALARSYHLVIALWKVGALLTSKTMMTPWHPLKQLDTMARYCSCPAVSQMQSFTTCPATVIYLILKSIVVTLTLPNRKSYSIYFRKSAVLPTHGSPIIIILNLGSSPELKYRYSNIITKSHHHKHSISITNNHIHQLFYSPSENTFIYLINTLIQFIQITMSQVINLPYVLPDLKKAKGFISGIRPYRQGGVRMEKSKEENGKTVYHNYGHGGAGISIAYGCVQHVFNNIFLQDKVDKKQEIAVIGAGIIGLTTAYFLVKLGYKVNMYAELTPFNHQKGQPQITTTVAAGYWMPLKVGNKAQTVAFAASTWKHYQEVISLQQKLNKNLGISTIPAYVLNDDDQQYHFRIQGVIEPKDCMVTFGDNNYYKAKKFTTLVVETHLYCDFLKEELEKSGLFKLQSKIFKYRADVQGLKENYIFNSMGLGSKEIFGDNNMRGIKGHIIKFSLNDFLPIKDFLLAMKTPQGGLLLQVPHRQSGSFMLGVTFQQGKTNPLPQMMGIQKAFEQSHNFYLQIDSHQLKPKL